MSVTFMGLPVVGDVTKTEKRTEQRTPAEFEQIVQWAMQQPGVTWFTWSQYTPYFNDGEPCVFRSYGLGSAEIDGVELDELWYSEESEAVLGKYEKKWSQVTRTANYDDDDSPYEGPNKERFLALKALDEALESGAFEDVLQDLFGDHCEVKVVVGDGIYIEEYNHD